MPHHPQTMSPKAVLFDLLTALLDSWSLWNTAAGSAEHGRAWRAEYLKLTYGCGAYVPYEDLVRRAAHNTGLPVSLADTLEDMWPELAVWDGVSELLESLRPHCKLAIVTNCSAHLGHLATQRIGIEWDCIVTAEEAGYYKPDPRPYQQALKQLNVKPDEAAFIAGSGFDLFGTARVGLRTYWHNRAGLKLPHGAPPPEIESSDLNRAALWLQQFHQLKA